MYRKIETLPTPVEKFELPFEGQLAEDNRWVIMANLIPWSEFNELCFHLQALLIDSWFSLNTTFSASPNYVPDWDDKLKNSVYSPEKGDSQESAVSSVGI